LRASLEAARAALHRGRSGRALKVGAAAEPITLGEGSPAKDPLDGASELGVYSIAGRLGSGGMGTVYEGRHRALNKRVAIKVLLPERTSDPEVMARFLREGQAAARVRHPHVVDVYDVGVEKGRYYLVMELLEGRDLQTLLDERERLPLTDALAVLLPVFSAISRAHAEGVVHRDLKPANVFLADEGGRQRPIVVDFGISKVIEAQPGLDLTQSAAVLGTPYYMAPEQLRAAKSSDARTDQYALGVILYECLTGHRPFSGAGLYELLLAIGQGPLKPPTYWVPSLPPPLNDAILRALARDPDQRFPSVQAFGRALFPFADELTRSLWNSEFGAGAAQAVSGDEVARTSHAGGGPRSRARIAFAVLGLALTGSALAWFTSTRTAPRAPSDSADVSAVAAAAPSETPRAAPRPPASFEASASARSARAAPDVSVLEVNPAPSVSAEARGSGAARPAAKPRLSPMESKTAAGQAVAPPPSVRAGGSKEPAVRGANGSWILR
jgi:serine/threonine-protein kinase